FRGLFFLKLDHHHTRPGEFNLPCLRWVPLGLLYPLTAPLPLGDFSRRSLLPLVKFPLNVRFTLAQDYLSHFRHCTPSKPRFHVASMLHGAADTNRKFRDIAAALPAYNEMPTDSVPKPRRNE